MPLIQIISPGHGGPSLLVQFLVACIPALLALLGVAYTLQSSRRQAEDSRVLAMKQKTYMEAIRCLMEGAMTLATYADIKEDMSEQLGKFRLAAPAIAKVHVVADMPLSVALANAMTHLSVAMMSLTSLRSKAERLAQQAEVLADLAHSSQNGIDAALAGMTAHNLEGSSDSRKFEVLQQNFEFSQTEKNKWMREETTVQRQLQVAVLDTVRAWESESRQLQRLMAPLLSAARRELRLGFDQDAFEELYDEQTKIIREAMRKFIPGLGDGAVVDPHFSRPYPGRRHPGFE